MMRKTFNPDFNDLGLTVSQIHQDMGYRKEIPDISITDLIREVLDECNSLKQIKAEYRVLDNIDFNFEAKSVRVEDIFFHVNNTVFSLLSNSESVAVFLCTAGAETASRINDAMTSGDILKSYVYDVTGSEIVEAVTELMHIDLDKTMAAQGMITTNRFNPGYCGWNVEEQHKLFTLMPENFCGIRLTESALMDPVKSVSGFIGIGKNVRRVPSTCSFCDMTECFYRRF